MSDMKVHGDCWRGEQTVGHAESSTGPCAAGTAEELEGVLSLQVFYNNGGIK